MTLLTLWSLLVSRAFSQTGQGTIVGLVTDSTSAVVAGASVTARNPETGFTYTALTNEEGLYRILYVNPGVYEIGYSTGWKSFSDGVQSPKPVVYG